MDDVTLVTYIEFIKNKVSHKEAFNKTVLTRSVQDYYSY